MERSITQAKPGQAPRGSGDAWDDALPAGRGSGVWIGAALVGLCFAAYLLIHPDRSNIYLHFVLQAQAWLDGHTAIPMPGYQDVMPLLTPAGDQTGSGIIPFPPLPAWVLLPFVSIWHLGTNQQLLSAVCGAIDVGLAYWMLGYLPVRRGVRFLTALFFGLGSVLFYSAAIGSTWFWAHIVAVACMLIAIGLALSADRDAAEPARLADALAAARRLTPRRMDVPGGLRTVAAVVAMAALGGALLVLASAGTPPAALPDGLIWSDGGTPAWVIATLGLLICLAAMVLAVSVAGRPGAAAPFAILVAALAGLPALLWTGQAAVIVLVVADALVLLAAFGLWWRGGRLAAPVLGAMSTLRSVLTTPEALQVAAGIFFGLAVTARLTVLFAFPFLMLVGGGGSWLRRTLLAGAGAAVPVVAMVVLTYATSGFVFNPAYVFQYDREVQGYGSLLGYHAGWAISDLRYVPQNLMIMLFGAPEVTPPTVGVFGPANGNPACVDSAVRGLFDTGCPLVMPDAVGTGLVWSSPAYVLALAAWRPLRRVKLDRLTVGAGIAVVGVAFVNLMHFSQGWVQFGYRFSNDFAPFAIVLVALGANRLGRVWPVLVPLVLASIAINFWGTIWGVILGW